MLPDYYELYGKETVRISRSQDQLRRTAHILTQKLIFLSGSNFDTIIYRPCPPVASCICYALIGVGVGLWRKRWTKASALIRSWGC